METFNVNYTTFGLGLTGGSRVLIEVANRLSAKGHDVTFTLLDLSNELKYTNKLSSEIKINKVIPRYKRLIWHGIFKLGKSQLKFDFDIEKLTKSIPDCDINVATNCFSVFSVHRSGKGIPFHDPG